MQTAESNSAKPHANSSVVSAAHDPFQGRQELDVTGESRDLI